MKRLHCFATVATQALMIASCPAMAQVGPTAGAPIRAAADTAPTGQQAAAATGQANSDSIADIIVTAQRFEQTAQRTPLVITTIGSAELTGISDVRQLQTVTPGIQLAPAGNVVQTFIRGVGTLAANAQQESAVAYNVDGVFLFTSTMISPLIYDLERVEVLKGPQGTLYGRNASGGAVNLITTGAKLGTVGGYAEGELGNYHLRRVTGALNLPLGNDAAVRFAGQHVEHAGYLSDGTDDQDLTSGRVRFRWEPSSDIKLQLGADVSHAGGLGAGSSITPYPAGDKFIGAIDPRVQTGSAAVGGTSLSSRAPNVPFRRDNQISVNGQLDANLGFATLTLLPAYRREHLDARNYIPGFENRDNTVSRQQSYEARLANRSNALRWVLGAYYFQLNQAANNIVRNESSFQGVVVSFANTVKSYAFFGETTVSLTPALRLIGGLRYNHEQTTQNGTSNANNGPPGLINPVTGRPNVQTSAYNPFSVPGNVTGELLDYPILNASRANAVTWKAGGEFDLSPTSLLFATASRGFKGGGAYADVPSTNSSFRPEYLTAFELGSRNRFLDNRLQVNVEAFYWRLRDQQVSYVGFNTIGQATFLTRNAGKAHMYGGSFDVLYRATPNDTVRLVGEYVESKYDSFIRVIPSLSVLPTTACNVTGYDPTRGSLAPATVDCSGQSLLRTPKFSGTASYQHRFDLGNTSNLLFDADVNYSTSRAIEASYGPLSRQKASTMANARLTYNAPGGRFAIGAWVRNISNARVATGGSQTYSFYARQTLSPPRTAGGSVRVNF